MKPTPLPDFWHKPADAGRPVALLATTFALEPDFFEENCLARFLEVTSVHEENGSSVDNIVARVELHELLHDTRVTVLADRSAPVQRTSLLWDLLSCQVGTGLLHAKVSVLLWENATRVILGSANLTAAGYRRQIELGLAADLGPKCLFPPGVLAAIADELQSYLLLVPGYDKAVPVFTRAEDTLDLFRRRIAQQPAERAAVRVAFAPTNATAGPLEKFGAAWSGPQPLRATHLSPFWDSNDAGALTAARELLTGRPAADRRQRVAVVLGPRGQRSFPQRLADEVDSVQELKGPDREIRTLHAKCLLIESREWIAALVGSSNHTRAGLGLSHRRHREMNVWLGAPASSAEGTALRGLVQLGGPVPPDVEEVEPKDEDEAEVPSLPTSFGLCRVMRPSAAEPWELHLGIADAKDMPGAWEICLTADHVILTRQQWETDGKPGDSVVIVPQESLPMYVLVRWEGNVSPWSVVADDRHALPPGPALSSLRAQHLLDALAAGRSLAQVLREELERAAVEPDAHGGIDLDPLRRFDDAGSLLRRGRALAASLNAMQRRLERPVLSIDTLSARLAGPLGPEFVGTKIVEAYEAAELERGEALFTIAEIALTVGRIDWAHLFEHIDRERGNTLVEGALGMLNTLCLRVGDGPADIASYAGRAIREARRCLS